jgi:hypothetical protein
MKSTVQLNRDVKVIIILMILLVTNCGAQSQNKPAVAGPVESGVASHKNVQYRGDVHEDIKFIESSTSDTERIALKYKTLPNKCFRKNLEELRAIQAQVQKISESGQARSANYMKVSIGLMRKRAQEVYLEAIYCLSETQSIRSGVQ